MKEKEEHLRDLEWEATQRTERAFDIWREWLIEYSSLLVEESIDALVKSDNGDGQGRRHADILREYWGLK